MLSRGDKIRQASGKLATLFELLSDLRYKLDTDADKAISDPALTEELMMFIYERWEKTDIDHMLDLFKGIYNSPNIPLDDHESIYKKIDRS